MEVQFWFFIKPRRQKLTPLNQFWKKSGFGFLKYLENEKILALDRINGRACRHPPDQYQFTDHAIWTNPSLQDRKLSHSIARHPKISN